MATIQIFTVMSDNFQWVNSTLATNKAICENLICNIFSHPKQGMFLFTCPRPQSIHSNSFFP